MNDMEAIAREFGELLAMRKPPKTVSVTECAEVLGVTTQAIRKALKKGRMPYGIKSAFKNRRGEWELRPG